MKREVLPDIPSFAKQQRREYGGRRSVAAEDGFDEAKPSSMQNATAGRIWKKTRQAGMPAVRNLYRRHLGGLASFVSPASRRPCDQI